MSKHQGRWRSTSTVLTVLLALQLLAAAYLILDTLGEFFFYEDNGSAVFLWTLYILVIIALLGSAIACLVLLRRLSAERAREQESVSIAKGLFGSVVSRKMKSWGLTAAEYDVAIFTLKGMNTEEIAALRDASTSTVRAQLSRVYKKASVKGRPELVGLFFDDFVDVLETGAN